MTKDTKVLILSFILSLMTTQNGLLSLLPHLSQPLYLTKDTVTEKASAPTLRFPLVSSLLCGQVILVSYLLWDTKVLTGFRQ